MRCDVRYSSFVCCKYTTKVKTFEWLTRESAQGIFVSGPGRAQRGQNRQAQVKILASGDHPCPAGSLCWPERLSILLCKVHIFTISYLSYKGQIIPVIVCLSKKNLLRWRPRCRQSDLSPSSRQPASPGGADPSP